MEEAFPHRGVTAAWLGAKLWPPSDPTSVYTRRSRITIFEYFLYFSMSGFIFLLWPMCVVVNEKKKGIVIVDFRGAFWVMTLEKRRSSAGHRKLRETAVKKGE